MEVLELLSLVVRGTLLDALLVVLLLMLGSFVSTAVILRPCEWVMLLISVVVVLVGLLLVLVLCTGLLIGDRVTWVVSDLFVCALNRYVLSSEPLFRWPVLRIDMYEYLFVVNKFLMIAWALEMVLMPRSFDLV